MGVRCKCGTEPYMEEKYGDNGSSGNGIMYRVECPKCGSKAPWRKSQMVAASEWESDFYRQ